MRKQTATRTARRVNRRAVAQAEGRKVARKVARRAAEAKPELPPITHTTQLRALQTILGFGLCEAQRPRRCSIEGADMVRMLNAHGRWSVIDFCAVFCVDPGVVYADLARLAGLDTDRMRAAAERRV